MPGLAFLTLSWVGTQARRSVPLRVEPVVRRDAEQAASKAKAAAQTSQPSTATRPRGRPQGSTNQPQATAPLPPE